MSFDPFASDEPELRELAPVQLLMRRDHKHAGRPKEACAECGWPKSNMAHWGAPPSLNVHGSGANRWVYQNLKKAWMARVTAELEAADPPLPKGLGGVLVEGEMCFPDRIRRDQGNFRFLMEKATGDALKEGGWIEDDCWSVYEFGGLSQAYEKGESWTRLVLFPRWPEPSGDMTLTIPEVRWTEES